MKRDITQMTEMNERARESKPAGTATVPKRKTIPNVEVKRIKVWESDPVATRVRHLARSRDAFTRWLPHERANVGE